MQPTPRSQPPRSSLRQARLLLGLVLAGCGPSGDPATSLPDAGTPSPDLATPGPITVTGTRVRTHITDPDQRSDQPVDLSGTTIEALVPDSGGSQLSTRPGIGRSDGSFSIPGVSLSAPYYLHLHSAAETPPHQYIHTAAASVDLGEYYGQRSSVVTGASGSELTWGNVGGLAAWSTGDQLLYYSSDNGLYLYGAAPAAGATSLSLTQSFVNQPLLSGARGDTLYVMQLHQIAVVDGSGVLAVSRALKLPAFDMTDAAPTPLSAAQASFSEPPLQTVSFDYRRSQFAALQSGSAPAANLGATGSHLLYVCALLGGAGLTYGFYTNSADLLAYSSPNASDVMLSQLRFGNPLSSSYGLFGYASSSFTASYALPGATTSVKLTAEATYTAPLADFAGAPVVPRLGPVTDLQINGQSAYTTTAKVTTQPVLSWSPPRLGKASDYVVAIHQLSLRSGTTQTVQKLLAQIRTTETRIVVPPGLLTSGEYYVFRVTSNARSGYDLARPFRGSFPASTAATLSTLVTP